MRNTAVCAVLATVGLLGTAPALSGVTMEFDGAAKCVAGCAAN